MKIIDFLAYWCAGIETTMGSGKCSEPQKLGVFGRCIGPKLKKLEGFFPAGEYGEVAIKKSE